MGAPLHADEQRAAEESAEIAVLCRSLDGHPAFIGILDDEHHQPMYELNRDAARALGYLLLQMSDYLPEPIRVVRRPRHVDEQLRDLEN